MPTHAEKRFSPHTPKQMFDLVADVERYPEFLPWCTGARIVRRWDNGFAADVMVGFKMVREKFTSEVTLHPPDKVDVRYVRGPFKYLNNHWQFLPAQDDQGHDGCVIDFYIDFEFRTRLLQKIMGSLFNEAVRRMVHAFEERADDLYGRP